MKKKQKWLIPVFLATMVGILMLSIIFITIFSIVGKGLKNQDFSMSSVPLKSQSSIPSVETVPRHQHLVHYQQESVRIMQKAKPRSKNNPTGYDCDKVYPAGTTLTPQGRVRNHKMVPLRYKEIGCLSYKHNDEIRYLIVRGCHSRVAGAFRFRMSKQLNACSASKWLFKRSGREFVHFYLYGRYRLNPPLQNHRKKFANGQVYHRDGNLACGCNQGKRDSTWKTTWCECK